MKRLLLTLLAFFPSALGFCGIEYTIEKAPNVYESCYEIHSEGKLVEVVERASSAFRTTYTLSNQWGPYAVGVCRLFSWGSLRNAWKVIDIWNHEDNSYIGTIQGICSKNASASFEFYDQEGKLFTIAEIDLERGFAELSHTNLFQPEQVKFYARRNAEGEFVWTYDQINVWFNRQMLQLFAAFLSDYFPPTRAFSG